MDDPPVFFRQTFEPLVRNIHCNKYAFPAAFQMLIRTSESQWG